MCAGLARVAVQLLLIWKSILNVVSGNSIAASKGRRSSSPLKLCLCALTVSATIALLSSNLFYRAWEGGTSLSPIANNFNARNGPKQETVTVANTTSAATTKPNVTKQENNDFEAFQFRLLIAVISGVEEFDRRMAVRTTWGDRQYLVRLLGSNTIGPIFFVGTRVDVTNDTRNSEMIEDKIISENKTYGDMVRVDEHDEFRRLTPKILKVFRYIGSAYLEEITSWPNLHVLKIDDDSYISFPIFLKYNRDHISANPPIDTFYCYVFKGAGVIRIPGHKYFVSKNEFEPDQYPPFCSGMGYMFRGGLLLKMLTATAAIKPLPMEDTYFTGVLAAAIEAKHTNISAIDPFNGLNSIPLERLCTYGRYKQRAIVHKLSPKQMHAIHDCALEVT